MRAASDDGGEGATSSERAGCPVYDEVAGFVDGALSPRTGQAFEAHLAGCADCRELVSALCRAGDASDDASRGSAGGSDRSGSGGDGLASSGADTLVDDPASDGAGPGGPGLEPALATGTAIGRYTVLDRIGAGGMGVVYAARDPELGRNVAIKLLRGDRAAADRRDELDDRLVHEARAMAQLAHPHVVAVFEIGRFRGQVFVVMELVDGQTLGRWLREAPRAWRAIVEMFAAAGQGLAAAHAAGLVHRDFKPANVLVGRDGRVRVTDFGLVQDAAPSGCPVRAGTPSYMAPEQFRGEPADARSDQFSFCVALYRALYDRRPFPGDTVDELAEAVTAGRAAPPPATARVPRWIGRAVLRGLATAAGDRHPTMADLLHALRRDPHRRLRRAAAIAAAIALAVTAATLLRGGARDPGPRCGDAAAERIAAVWSAASRQRVERAFAATGKPFAGAAFAEVVRVLDGRARRWTDLRSDLCETARDRPGSADQVAGLRALCLDRRLSELRSFVAVLGAASADVVQRAPEAAHRLAELDDCADPRALLGAPPPADPAARAQVAALRDQLAGAQALYRLGRYAEARDRARGLLDAVRATRDRPLEAETQLAIGMAAYDSGDYPAAEPALHAAVFAAEAGRSDEVAVRGLLYLVYFEGILHAHYEQAARDAAPRILAILERLGGNAELEGKLRVALSWMWLGANRFADAEREAARAQDVLERRFGASDIRIAAVLHTRIWCALFRADAATAVALAERLLAIRIRILGDDHPDVATAHYLVGLTVQHTRRAGDARAAFARAEAIDDRTLGPDHPEMTDLYSALANYNAAMGQMAEALAYNRRAAAIAEKTSGVRSRPYGQLRGVRAQYLADLDRDGEALAALDEAQAALQPTLGDASMSMSDLRLTTAEVLGHLGRYAEARRDAEASLAILDRLLGPDHPWSALRHRVLGEIDLATGRPRDALAAFERARTLIDPDDGTLARARADIDFGLARALAALGRDAPRARALAASARTVYAGFPELAGRLRRIDAWLAHRAAR